MSAQDTPARVGLFLRSINSQQISAEEYAGHYETWGGSFIVHPAVLLFLQGAFGIPTDYRGYFLGGKCIGALATWGKYVAGDQQALRAYKVVERIDFGSPVIFLPIAPGHKLRIHYRASYLLSLQQTQIAGAVFTRLKGMSILRNIPTELPSGKKSLQTQERRFLKLGGSIRDISEFSPSEIAGIYEMLFRIRWNRMPQAAALLRDNLQSFRKFLYGKVLWFQGRPVAIQINYRADTSKTICVDYVNGGVDKPFHSISPGSLLSYINGRTICAEARIAGKRLVYSYGKANTPYKDQWCVRIARGYTGFWLP